MSFRIITLSLLLALSSVGFGQSSEEVWGIGTKWTYEYVPFSNVITYLSQEITDTSTVDGIKLYHLESTTSSNRRGIDYLHYKDGDVYSYDPGTKILQLLYDFDNTEYYPVEYRPICDPFFPYDSLEYKTYYAQVNQVEDYLMPDDSHRMLQSISLTDTIIEDGNITNLVTVHRQVLNHIGFLSGYLHQSHDWELGIYICDDWGNYVSTLRCFENDSISYNFKDYPCDSTWILTSTQETDKVNSIRIYPNPSNGKVWIKPFNTSIPYEVLDASGKLIAKGICKHGYIGLSHAGLNIIKLSVDAQNWEVFKVYNNQR